MLSWLPGVVVVLVAAALLLLPACWPRARSEGSQIVDEDDVPQRPGEARPAAPTKSRKDIDEALQKLATTPAPPTENQGAMCYAMAVQPESQVTYVCPTHGERVVYNSRDPLGWLAEAVGGLRQQVRRLRRQGLDVNLDEQGLCPKQVRQGQEASVDLLIRFPGESAPHRHRHVTDGDLELLEEFMGGGGVHRVNGSDTEPLLKSIPRLRELLGMPEQQAPPTPPVKSP